MEMKIKFIDTMKNKENAERNASPAFPSIEYLLETVNRFSNEMNCPSNLIAWIEFSRVVNTIVSSMIDEASVEELKEVTAHIKAMRVMNKANE